MPDKKIKKMTIPELAYALTQHADDLQLFAHGVSEDAEADFEQTESAVMEIVYELYARFEKGEIPMDYATRRYLDGIEKKIADIRESLFEDEAEEVTHQARETVKNEGKFLKAFYSALTGIAAIGLDADWYDRISKYGIYNGETIKQIIDRIAGGDIDRLYSVAVDSVKKGLELDQIRELIRKELQKTSRFAQTEINSIINGAANDAALAFSFINKTKIMYCAVLDDKVCEECAGFDGTIYDYMDDDIPSLPRHNNCRCRLVPVPEDTPEMRDLALPFPEYVGGMGEEEQEARLGSAKFDLWKSGKYQLKTYESPRPGQRMTMAELRERDKRLFARA